jgi:hypothetical protein
VFLFDGGDNGFKKLIGKLPNLIYSLCVILYLILPVKYKEELKTLIEGA